LRRLREAAQLTCDEVAARLDCSASKISRIETGRVLASPRDVRDLLSIYDVPENQRDSLIQLARESRQKGWWHTWGDVQPHFATYLGMESEASQIRQYGVARLPTLLQTVDYAREVVTGGRTGEGKYAGPVDRVVEMLMERQRLAVASPPTTHFVLDEAALRRQVGGRKVMREQIEHLIELSSMKGMILQFIPFTGGAHVALDLPFVLLSFPDPADRDVVAVGYATGMLWLEDAAEVHSYASSFGLLQAVALSPADSRALMASVLKDM